MEMKINHSSRRELKGQIGEEHSFRGGFSSLFDNQISDFRLPHEEDEDDEALQTVQDVADVENEWTFEDPRNSFHTPRSSHDDKQPEVKVKPD
jgi:hypothetical protein